MITLQRVQVCLDANQRVALNKMAKADGVSVSAIIRDAIDANLLGVTVDELRLLANASAQTTVDFDAMAKRLKATNAKLDQTFRMIEAMKVKQAA
ncbi:MAG: ribbon-helix-helix protein, CopG family [Betaproteobacteria bacterium]|nr:ribbon-helix-helix protein, CopG family [Betaproteobacteria bacterium]